MSVPLHVLIVGLNYEPESTGIAPYTSRMAAGLRGRGHQVSVVTAFPHYPQWRIDPEWKGSRLQEQRDGVSITRVRHYVPRRPTGLRRAFSEVSFGLRAASQRVGDPDVVICVSPALISSVIVRAAMRFTRRRAAFGVVIQDLYSVGITESGGGRLMGSAMRAIESRIARQADGVSVIHDRFKQKLVTDLGVSGDKVRVIRNWTHTPAVGHFDREAARRRFGWGADDVVVLHAGAMGEKQGLGGVVEAARVADATGSKVRFVLMGDGGQRAALMAQGRDVRSLEFLDPQPSEAFGLMLRSADMLLVHEKVGIEEMAVPSKLTSYFQAGVPVVAVVAASGTTAHEVLSAGAGVLVTPAAPQELVSAVERLAADPAHRATLAEAGPVYCERVLSEDVALDHYDAWARQLIGQHQRHPSAAAAQ